MISIAIFNIIKSLIDRGDTEEQILKNDYLCRHYTEPEILKLIIMTQERINYFESKTENQLKYNYSFRLSPYLISLLKKQRGNRAKLIRIAIEQTYGRATKENSII